MRIPRAPQFHGTLRYFLIVGILFVQSLATYGQSVNAADVRIENFGKVNENYYRGSQPLVDQFTQLKTLGIKTVIDLREDSVKQASEWARAAGLQYINIPLTTKRAASEEQTQYFLKLVNWYKPKSVTPVTGEIYTASCISCPAATHLYPRQKEANQDD